MREWHIVLFFGFALGYFVCELKHRIRCSRELRKHYKGRWPCIVLACFALGQEACVIVHPAVVVIRGASVAASTAGSVAAVKRMHGDLMMVDWGDEPETCAAREARHKKYAKWLPSSYPTGDCRR